MKEEFIKKYRCKKYKIGNSKFNKRIIYSNENILKINIKYWDLSTQNIEEYRKLELSLK